MESLSIKDDDLCEKQVVVPGKKTILNMFGVVSLAGTGNPKQYKVYSNRTSDTFLQHLSTEIFLTHWQLQRLSLLAKKCVPREFMGYFFNQKLETAENIQVYNLFMCNSCCYFSFQPLLYLLRALMCAQPCTQSRRYPWRACNRSNTLGRLVMFLAR